MRATSNEVAPSGRVSFTSDPAASKVWTACMLPLRAANKSGVAPLLERAPMSAPCSISVCTTGTCPSAAAHMSADCPFQVSCTLMSAPTLSSTVTASTCPERAASISGVSPAFTACSGSFGSTPALTSCSTIAALPFLDASPSGVTP